jgi:hypothetical protein
LPANPPVRRVHLLALALALAALLTLPARTLAQGRNDSCRTTGANADRAGRDRACAPATRTAGASTRRRTRSKSRTRGRRHHHAHRSKKGARIGHGTPIAPQPTPSCQDGSAPEAVGVGSFACDDGSEPTCADGSTPVVSADGSTLVCEADANAGDGGESASEPVCEDGSQPILGAGGYYSCDDGSEPECEGGIAPVLSSDGSTLVCQPASGGESEAEGRE